MKRNVWERQPGESPQAYEAFSAYRDMEKRSSAKVVQKLGKSRALIQRWSSAWNWVERARAWDNELTREARKEAVQRVKEMTARHISISMQLQKKALEELGALELGSLSPSEILSYLVKAADIERIARLELLRLYEQDHRHPGNEKPCGLAAAITAAYLRRIQP